MSECLFCRGRPVLNAGGWFMRGEPKYAACPRCGRRWTEAELAELEREGER